MARPLFFVAGWLCLGLAVVGAVLPLIPCTPFLLLAVACFARSSTRAMNRLRRSPLLGTVLRDWQRHRGMRLSAKITAVSVAIAAPLLMLAISQQFDVSFFVSTIGGGVALVVVGRLPTVRVHPSNAERFPQIPQDKASEVRAPKEKKYRIAA